MRYLHTLLFLLIITSILTSYGQQRRFGHYGLQEGLPQETILCIDNDSNDFLWFGTSDGTVRFDGTNFYVPPADKNTGLDLSGWRVGAILVDNNTVYSGTGQKGVLAYHTLTNKTTAIGLPNSNCSALTKIKEGILIGYYNQGIGQLDSLGNFKILNFGDTIIKNSVALIQYQAHIYVGTDQGEFYRFSTQQISEEKEITPEKIKTFNGSVNGLILKDDELYIASSQGLFNYNNGDILPVTITTIDNIEASFDVRDVVVIKAKTFIATSQGLLEGEWITKNRFNFKKRYTANVKYDPFTINGSSINDIHLHNNVLSIGVMSLDLTTIKTQQVFKNVLTKYNLGNPSVFAVLETESQLWVGSSSGLVIIDKSSEKFTILKNIKSRSIVDDGKGNIWVGSGKRIYVFPTKKFDYDTPVNINVNKINTNNFTLSNLHIRNIYNDRQGKLWVVTFKDGVYAFNGNVANQEFTFDAIVTNEKLSKLPSPFALDINQDFNNNYWITTQKGLSKMTLDENGNTTFQNYYEQDGLAASGVLSTLIDHKGKLWVATRKGVSVYNENTDAFTSYKKRDGLSNAFVYHILEDDDHNLWLSTNGGLFLFDRQFNTFANYTPKDGVQSTEFNLGARFKNKEGDLYFGGIAGLNKFNPKEVASLDKESTIQFTQFKSNQEHIENTNSKTTVLKVPHDVFPLNISFAAMDFRPSKNIEYQYRLSSENQQWNRLGDKNEVQFLSLPSGTHKLEIQGISRGRPWAQEPLTLDLTITPPWYKSTIAYLGYLLLFLAGVYLYYKIALQRKLAGQEAKRLQDLDDLKSRFITNITHEFRTPLTIILGYVDTLKSKLTDKNSETEDLKTIEQNSENLLGLVNQMLDLAKLEQGRLDIAYTKADVSKFTNYVAQSFESLAEDKEVALRYISKIEDPVLDFDAEKLRQILTNLVSNAIKFTEKGQKVTVTLSEINAKFQITVADTGAGIPEEDVAQIFDRFYQVQNNSFKVSQGTGIGLALTKELVQLLDGTITAQSKLGEGTTFRVQLPITRIAIDKDVDASISTIANQGIQVPAAKSVVIDQDAPTVLIVEDNKDMSRYISSCLQDSFKVTTAFNGQKGFDKATKETPDIIISDVMMPVMDGFEMTQKLQSQEATNHIPIVLLTSKALQEDKLEGLESGADAYLTKPFQKAELLLRIHKLIEKRKTLQKRYQIATVLLEKKQDKKPIADKNILFLNKAISSIHDNLADTSFNSEMLSRELALSDSQLYRKLKAITNTSTAIFIRKVRLEKAKELLETTTKNVSEIAYETGFNDPNWFGKVFKESFDVSPSQIRK